MGERITRRLRRDSGARRGLAGHAGNGPANWRWLGHHQLKKPFFGRFMKPWRWPADVPQAGWSSLRIASRSGSSLAAVLARTPAAQPLGVVVCAHPMGLAAKGFWLRYGHAQRLLAAGFHVLAFDFNGFGESPSTNFDWPGDLLSAGQWAKGQFPGLPVHALCASFGAIQALSAVDDADFVFSKVVAEAVPPSLPDFWKAYPFANAVLALGNRLVPSNAHRIHPLSHIARLPAAVQVLLVHSQADRWTPVAFGDALQQAAPTPAQVRRLVLDKADHTHGLRDEPDLYWPAVHGFLAQAV